MPRGSVLQAHPVPAESPTESASPLRSDKAKALSFAMLLIGLVLLWPVPLGGALFVASAALGLTMTEREH